MEGNFSSISSSYQDNFYPNENLTLFDKIEKMMNNNNQGEFKTFIEKLNNEDDIKNPGQNSFEAQGRNTYFNSQTSSNNGKKNSFFEYQSDFIDNDIKNKIIPLLENQNILSNSENAKEDNKEEKLSKSFELKVNDNKRYSEKHLLGKKRNLKEKKIIQSKEDIFQEIKLLFDKYNRKYNLINKIVPSYKIFEAIDGVSKKNATVVENKIPGCIIYFYEGIITHIFLIGERLTLKEEKDILEILNLIKKNISKIC